MDIFKCIIIKALIVEINQQGGQYVIAGALKRSTEADVCDLTHVDKT